MADKKIEKALYGPSLTEVGLGAVLGLVAGVLAACVFLVFFKPVMPVKEMPPKDKQVQGTIYYLLGGDSSAKSRTWSAKQKQFVAGTSSRCKCYHLLQYMRSGKVHRHWNGKANSDLTSLFRRVAGKEI